MPINSRKTTRKIIRLCDADLCTRHITEIMIDSFDIEVELRNYQNHDNTIEVSWQRKIVTVPSGSDEFDEKAPTRFDAFRGAPDIRF